MHLNHLATMVKFLVLIRVYAGYIKNMLDKSKLQNLNTQSPQQGNFSEQEVARFDALAETWWDPKGKYKTALLFNQARISYFLPQIARHFKRDLNVEEPLKGLSILDVGSGGGLVCEPLAKAGATVIGIDASQMSVEVARRHALSEGLDIEYRHQLSSQLVQEKERFDVVINAEVVEHVPDQQALISECCQLVNPNGLLVLATLNRNIKSWIIAILGAEYVMRYLPRGTHDWSMFVKPNELNQMASVNGMTQVAESGMKYNPFSKRWLLSDDTSVNYMQCYTK